MTKLPPEEPEVFDEERPFAVSNGRPGHAADAADPFADLFVRDRIRARVHFVQSLWTDESKFEQIVTAGRYFQLCEITEKIYDSLSLA